MGHNSISPSRISAWDPEIHGMDGLWGAGQGSMCSSRVLNKGWNFKVIMVNGEIRNKDPEVRHLDIKQGGGVRKSSTLKFLYFQKCLQLQVPQPSLPLLSIMSLQTLILIQKLTRQPRMQIWSFGRIRRRWDRLLRLGETLRGLEETGGGEEAQIVVATKLAAEQAAELVVDREQRILLQVSLIFLWFFTGSWLQIRKTWRCQSWHWNHC